ncbi:MULTISPECIES: cell division protein SepF [Bacillus cereus group]|uniref:Cell division protein SepF n=1 Tax=Bacillus thuringiensis serovar andalousiensis TaxID=257985 RepID=A0A6H0TNI0_BACTU|nr:MULTISPECIES: cell division protein SepF [Bacillus cereus group]MDM5430767.1 cell division protein SepF [Bacillus mycoides]QIW21214.1 cell division protein SepF [Bacillus thuringiensis serovar andalousiensis]
MTEQLTFLLDDTSNATAVIKNTKDIKFMEQAQPFDISKSHAKHLPGRVGFADVLAMIPCDVWSADELQRSVRQDNHFDMYIDYVTALWRYKRGQDKSFFWDEAEELCKDARESQEPQPLRIYFDSGFKPQYVIEYL